MKSAVVRRSKRSKDQVTQEDKQEEKNDVSQQSEQELTESSSESEDDENAALITAETEAEVLRTVALLRAKDPRIYQKELQLYDDSKLEKAEEVWKSHVASKTGKKDPLTLRGIYQKNILLGNASEEITETPVDGFRQDNFEGCDEFSFKNELKDAFAREDQDDDLLVLKEKSTDTLEREDREYKEFLFQSLSADKVTSQTATDWFSLKDDMNEDDKFLINYVLNRGWIERTVSKKEAESVSLEDDEKELEKIDEFEFNHNFRYEAGTEATKILSFPRLVEDSVRSSTNSKRKRQREAKKQRQQEAIDTLADQFKREKNALKKELRMKELEEELDKEMEEEYYRKNFEDVIEGMPTRFKYVSVQKTSFGLSTEDILMADDELLSKHAPSKCYAPFITPQEHCENEEKYGAKKRVYKFRDLLKRSLENEAAEQNN